MFFVDYWWIILQLGLAVFASSRGWGFAPWALLVKGIILVWFLSNINPALVVIGGIVWPDMLITLILFLMVAFRNDGEEVAQTYNRARPRRNEEYSFEQEYGYAKSVHGTTASEAHAHEKVPSAVPTWLGPAQ